MVRDQDYNVDSDNSNMWKYSCKSFMSENNDKVKSEPPDKITAASGESLSMCGLLLSWWNAIILLLAKADRF